MSDIIGTPALPGTRRLSFGGAAWLVGAFFCAAFALMTAFFPMAVASGTRDIWVAIQGLFTSADYSFGPHSSVSKRPLYLHAFVGLSLHTIAGGGALLAATTQFIPMIRRRWPLLHRTTGVLVVLLVSVSMVGSLVILASHPLAATLSGAGFGIGLASLCGLTLTELAFAVLAIRARDYRSHMGWMALMFASLLTAPALRVQWLLFGASGLHLDEANLVVAVFLVPETILLMAFWMLSVGARDLGIGAATSIVPPAALRVLGVAAALVVFHEGCLAPLGVDLIRPWRGAGPLLPKTAILWAFATAGLALRAPHDLRRLADERPVRPATTGLAIAAAVGSMIVAFALDGHGLQAIALRSCCGAWGVEIILLATLGRRAALGHVAPWDMQWLYLAFAPALWPFLACSYAPLGVGAPVAMTTAVSLAYATIAMLGFASAFGLTIAIPKQRSAPRNAMAPT